MQDGGSVTKPLHNLLAEVRACRHCEAHLPLGCRPVVAARAAARLLIIGQAPGTRVHESGIPWNDPSGDRLRDWMDIDRDAFYDPGRVAIMPMGFCYPGRDKGGGDSPPRPECAPLWHSRIRALLPNIELTLLVGGYAQAFYLSGRKRSVTDRVRDWREHLPDYLPLPHPSWRTKAWAKRNPWFEGEVVPELKSHVRRFLS